MKSAVYFNEIEPFCAQWLRNQFGDVDERDIRQIERPVDAIRQHYFAGLGGWEWALRLAGWPADQEVWTGSCPCQPFSVAGKGQAHEDARDLWPAFLRLITIGRPPVIVGEQVNGAITYGWLDRVCDDLEGIGYAVGAAVLPACGIGAPHIRQRLYWVAIRLAEPDCNGTERTGRTQLLADAEDSNGGMAQSESQLDGSGHSGTRWRPESTDGGDVSRLEFPALERREQGWSEPEWGRLEPRRDFDWMGNTEALRCGTPGRNDGFWSAEPKPTGGMGDTDQARGEGRDLWGVIPEQGSDQLPARATGETGGMAHSADTAPTRQRGVSGAGLPIAETGSPWAASRSIWCQDGRYRRIPLEPGIFALVGSGTRTGDDPDSDGPLRNGSDSEELNEDLPAMSAGIPTTTHEQRQAPEILQPPLRQYARDDQRQGEPNQGATDAGGSLSAVRSDNRAAEDEISQASSTAFARSSSRRESTEQRDPESADVVQYLSQVMALGAWSRTLEKICALQDLSAAFASAGLLPKTFPEIQATWRSLAGDEARRRHIARFLVEHRQLNWPAMGPLADDGRFGNPRVDRHLSSRIGALQAAGNAIVIPLAAEFIRAVMEVLVNYDQPGND